MLTVAIAHKKLLLLRARKPFRWMGQLVPKSVTATFLLFGGGVDYRRQVIIAGFDNRQMRIIFLH
jgi:hypothetical protein